MWAPHVTTASSSAVVMAPSSPINDLQKQKHIINNTEIMTQNCNEGPLIVDNTNRNLNYTNNQNGSISAQETVVDISTAAEDLQQLIDEMRVKDFDSIRFATYRTACKLRFVQSKTNVHLVDIWNMIESFRENGLNAIPTSAHLKISRLELLLTSVFHNLNKRLPTTQQIDTDRSISMLLSFLLGVYDRQNIGRLTIFSIKVGLATLCAGKLVDKLRYIFSQISDSSGIMEYEKFADYLQQVLALPSAVFEAPTFGFNETALLQCFKREDQVNLNHFLDVIISDSCPPCLMWLPLLHRMASVEHVYHPVVCDACQIRSFTGFRYKCQRCANYQLCQSCFWRGQTSQTHSNEHEMKEYSSYKSPTKQIAHSIQKSLQCVPMQQAKTHKTFPTKPQRMLDLANIVPVTPTALRHQAPELLTDWTTNLLPGQYGNGNTIDDEHKLIARYAAKLAGRTSFPLTSKYVSPHQNDAVDEHALIAQLEEENNEMLREIAILEQQQNMSCSNGQLNGLREQTKELEEKMREKQQLRRQLMQQLEQLMAQLNNTPGPSKRLGNTDKVYSVTSLTNGIYPEELSGIRNMVSNAFRNCGGTENLVPVSFANMSCTVGVPAAQLQGNLLQAASAITSNMSNLVLELDQATDNENNAPNLKKNIARTNENTESFE